MKSTPAPENPLLNLVINIFLPVFVLNKAGAYVGPHWTLLLALSLPLGYGLYDYIKRRHKNYVSLLGLVNILLTGGLALLSLSGIWFAVKEACLPILLGILVLGSAWTQNPAAKMMFCNPQVLNMELIEERVLSLARADRFRLLLRTTTLWLSLSFFISALLNFVLGFRIFEDIDKALPADQQAQILNEQIARMTWAGFAVIAMPLMVFSGFLIYYFLRSLSRMLETPIQSLMKV